MIIFGGVSEPLPSLPGVLGQTDFQFQMQASIDGPARGIASLSSPYFSEVNSQIGIVSVERVGTDVYIFGGIVKFSRQPDWVGRPMKIKVFICPSDNCDLELTIENTPVQGMLLPAIQKVREAAAR